MNVVVYGDFNCLLCYLASQRADRLVGTGAAGIEWRAVERGGLDVARDLLGEVREASRSAPDLDALAVEHGKSARRRDLGGKT